MRQLNLIKITCHFICPTMFNLNWSTDKYDLAILMRICVEIINSSLLRLLRTVKHKKIRFREIRNIASGIQDTEYTEILYLANVCKTEQIIKYSLAFDSYIQPNQIFDVICVMCDYMNSIRDNFFHNSCNVLNLFH